MQNQRVFKDFRPKQYLLPIRKLNTGLYLGATGQKCVFARKSCENAQETKKEINITV